MHHLARTMVSGLALLGASIAGFGCQSVLPADPYMGTISGDAFDPLFGTTPGAPPQPRCLAPRKGYGGGSGLEPVTWIYLGALSRTQLDISGATDLTRTPPTGAYVISGCTVHDTSPYDARTENFVKTVQYPVLSNASPEPTTPSSYKPWHLVVPVALRDGREIGCNDVKSQRSIEDRSGWDRQNKVFGQGAFDPAVLANYPYGYSLPEGGWTAGLDLQPKLPTRDDIRAGKFDFMDWPMVNVAAPVMKTSSMTASCPLMTGNKARYPRYPGDPQADFQFPQQAWLRGLMSGYLDGGKLPVTTEAAKCPALVSTGKSCPMGTECDMGKAEVCSAGKCLGRLPICPVINEVYLPDSEVLQKDMMGAFVQTMGLYQIDTTKIAAATIDLTDMTGKRTADTLAVFAATPGSPGASPVCRVRIYDPTKLTCARKEAEAIAPRPLCTAQEIQAQAVGTPAVLRTIAESYIHCLFPAAPKS